MVLANDLNDIEQQLTYLTFMSIPVGPSPALNCAKIEQCKKTNKLGWKLEPLDLMPNSENRKSNLLFSFFVLFWLCHNIRSKPN